jgi:ATP-dependent Clp protease ATP-binding subunit ClpA
VGPKQARETGRQQAGTEHLLLGLLDVEGNAALRLLPAMGVDTDALRRSVLERTA